MYPCVLLSGVAVMWVQLLEGEEDRLGKIINNPAIDSVITLIQFRDLVKVRQHHRSGYSHKSRLARVLRSFESPPDASVDRADPRMLCNCVVCSWLASCRAWATTAMMC